MHAPANMSLDPDILQALVRIIEMKDLSTAAHTWRVVLYARAMCEALGMPSDFVERVAVGAALHDLGKIDVPSEILQKPGRLSDAEFVLVRAHPVLGFERLRAMGVTDPLVLALVRHHHERVDGKGYPDGLFADRIPLPARFFAVIDSFDALTSRRPYRHDVGVDAAARAIEELYTASGTQYYEPAVEALDGLFRDGRLTWIMDHFNDGAAPAEWVQVDDVATLRDRFA
jgi:putative nucleotidyltransferase with HDIG domain